MEFADVLEQTIVLLQQQGRISYGALKRRFGLDDAYLDDLKIELIEAQKLACDENGRILLWAGPSAPAAPQVLETIRHSLPPVTQSEPSHLEQRTSDAERRQLTVLFCDLVDSTVLSSRLDPEDLREVIRAYQGACAAVIEPLEGHIAQYLGDGLLVYFGYPQAHEDDAHRAIRAGLGMVAAIQALNTHLAQRHGMRLAVRLGIHTGLVVLGDVGGGSRQERLALGETPNVAARLQGLAAPDTVVVSAATFRLVQGYFASQDLGAHDLKGVAEPAHLYRILGESGIQSRLEAGAQGRLTSLVGREEEVALLRQRWEQAQAGQGQVVVLSGEAGIGKSRLVQVLKEHVASEPHTRIEWRGSSYHQQSALYPVIMHLHRLLRWQEQETPEATLSTLETLLTASGLALPDVVPLLAALLALPLPAHYAALTLTPQLQRRKTLEALLTWLAVEARRQPVLVIVEDLHWIDPSTLELLSLLIDQAASARCCLLLTTRPEFRSPWAMAAHLTALTLRRFTPAQVMRLATHVAGEKALPSSVLEEVVRKTDGVPLFVEELTKVVLESGLLQEQDECYELMGPLPPLAIPATLHDALMARLDRLAAAKLVAQLGATIGRTFAYDLLQTVAPLNAAILQQALAQLVEAELVAQRGMPPQAVYTFRHALIQDTAYQSLLRSTRQQYHQQIAQALEAQFPDVVETQPELLAHHYTEAGLGELAVTSWQRAGDRANRHSAYAEAIAHLSKGLAVLRTLPETPARNDQEIQLHLALGPPLLATQGNAASEVGRSYARIQELCQEREDPSLRIGALQGLRLFHTARAEHHQAMKIGEEALRVAQAVGDLALLAKAHQDVGVPLYYLGRLRPAHEHFRHSLTYADSLPDTADSHSLDVSRSAVICRCYVSRVLWALGYAEQSQQWCDDALMRSHRVSDLRLQGIARMWAVHLYALRLDWSRLQEKARNLMAFCAEHGLPQVGAVGTIMLAWWRVLQDHDRDGLTQLHQAIQDFRDTGGDQFRPYWLSQLAEAYVRLGQPQDGLAAIEEAFAVMHATEEYVHHAKLHQLKGVVLLACSADHHAEAETCFHQALAIARSQDTKAWELRAATSLARLWQRQGKRAEAYELLAPVYGWFSEGFDTADLQEAKALLADLGGSPGEKRYEVRSPHTHFQHERGLDNANDEH